MVLWFGRIGLPIVAAIISVGLLPSLFGSWPSPNLVLAGVIYLLLTGRVTDALAWAVIGGLILDATAAGWPLYLPLFMLFVLVALVVIDRFGPQLHIIIMAIWTMAMLVLAAVVPALYAEAGWAFYVDGGTEPWEFQFGAEYSPLGPTGLAGAPFLAVNGHLRQEVDFGGSLVVQAGWQWRGRTGHLMRAGLEAAQPAPSSLVPINAAPLLPPAPVKPAANASPAPLLAPGQ